MLFYIKKKDGEFFYIYFIFRITLKIVLYLKKKTNKNQKQKPESTYICSIQLQSISPVFKYAFLHEHLQHKVLLLKLKIKALVLFDWS